MPSTQLKKSIDDSNTKVKIPTFTEFEEGETGGKTGGTRAQDVNVVKAAEIDDPANEEDEDGNTNKRVDIVESPDLRSILMCLNSINDHLRKQNIMIGEMTDIEVDEL